MHVFANLAGVGEQKRSSVEHLLGLAQWLGGALHLIVTGVRNIGKLTPRGLGTSLIVNCPSGIICWWLGPPFSVLWSFKDGADATRICSSRPPGGESRKAKRPRIEPVLKQSAAGSISASYSGGRDRVTESAGSARNVPCVIAQVMWTGT